MSSIYATGDDFGDNHVFIPGQQLSTILMTVDAVANVERVGAD